jgi:hypothetical protein
MTSPLLALRAAILAACAGDPALGGLMGGAGRIHDEPPRGEDPLYAQFGPAELRDLSTSSDRGHEQDLSIVVWAVPGSGASALAVAARMADLLEDSDLGLSGHRLVNLGVRALEVDRDRDSNLVRVTLRLRAVTEVVA